VRTVSRLEKSFILRAAGSGLQPARTVTSTSDIGGVLRPHLRQSPVDSGVTCAGSAQHPRTAYRSLSLLPLQSTHLKIDWINTGHHKNLDTIGSRIIRNRE